MRKRPVMSDEQRRRLALTCLENALNLIRQSEVLVASGALPEALFLAGPVPERDRGVRDGYTPSRHAGSSPRDHPVYGHSRVNGDGCGAGAMRSGEPFWTRTERPSGPNSTGSGAGKWTPPAMGSWPHSMARSRSPLCAHYRFLFARA
jgi:hypothetical protein